MHLALRRYAEPASDAFHYFAVGVVSALITLAGIAERLDEIEEIAVGAAQHDRDIARANATVDAYAYRAFPAWVQQYPEVACPARRYELDVYIAGATGFDPWGMPYRYTCTEHGPFVAWSFGPDGVAHTADDVRSHW